MSVIRGQKLIFLKKLRWKSNTRNIFNSILVCRTHTDNTNQKGKYASD